jgi:hypothetical protein
MAQLRKSPLPADTVGRGDHPVQGAVRHSHEAVDSFGPVLRSEVVGPIPGWRTNGPVLWDRRGCAGGRRAQAGPTTALR